MYSSRPALLSHCRKEFSRSEAEIYFQGIKPGRVKPSLEDEIDYLNIAKVEYPLIINTIMVTAFTNKRVFGLILLLFLI